MACPLLAELEWLLEPGYSEYIRADEWDAHPKMYVTGVPAHGEGEHLLIKVLHKGKQPFQLSQQVVNSNGVSSAQVIPKSLH